LEEKSSIDEKITKAFHRIVCRMPDKKEAGILKSYYDEQLQQFKQKKLDAAATIKAGEYPMDNKLDANTTAALMKVINTIYNMEETITKS
jgi:hypothetical protein